MNKDEALSKDEKLRIVALSQAVKLFRDCSKYDRGDVFTYSELMLKFLKGKTK